MFLYVYRQCLFWISGLGSREREALLFCINIYIDSLLVK